MHNLLNYFYCLMFLVFSTGSFAVQKGDKVIYKRFTRGTVIDVRLNNEGKACWTVKLENEHKVSFVTEAFELSADKSLLANYYQFTEKGLTRYEDITNHWAQDLMPSDFYFGASPIPQFNPPFEHLKNQFRILPNDIIYEPLEAAINDYHALTKTDEALIALRVDSLKDIARKAAELLQVKKNNSTVEIRDLLQSIVMRANLKADYLKKLSALPKEAGLRSASLPKNNENAVVSSKADTLKNIDPEKRNHGARWSKWNDKFNRDPFTTPDYFLWLEGEDTTTMQKDLHYVFLPLNDKKLVFDEYGVAFNKIFRETLSNHVSDGDYLYTISEDGDLYISPFLDTFEKIRAERPLLFQMNQYPENATLTEVFTHDTVMAGINVLCAGILTFDKGKIIYIDNDSGHYQPLMIKHLRPALAKLLKKYPNSIDKDTSIGKQELSKSNKHKIIEPHCKKTMPYHQFLKATPKDFGEESKNFSPQDLIHLGIKNIDTNHLKIFLRMIDEEIYKMTELKNGIAKKNWLINPYTGERFSSKDEGLAAVNRDLAIVTEKMNKAFDYLKSDSKEHGSAILDLESLKTKMEKTRETLKSLKQ